MTEQGSIEVNDGDLRPGHTEMWLADKPEDPSRPWGWQCFRCAANEPMYATLADAEADAARHEQTGCAVLPL